MATSLFAVWLGLLILISKTTIYKVYLSGPVLTGPLFFGGTI